MKGQDKQLHEIVKRIHECIINNGIICRKMMKVSDSPATAFIDTEHCRLLIGIEQVKILTKQADGFNSRRPSAVIDVSMIDDRLIETLEQFKSEDGQI